MKKTILVISMAFIGAVNAQSQQFKMPETIPPSDPILLIGIGYGLDYGGIGFKAEYLPIKYVGMFGAAGYNFVKAGYSAGISLRPLPDAVIQPVLLAMYGTNAAIKVNTTYYISSTPITKSYSKVYNGFSVGLGGDIKIDKRQDRISIGVLYPFRNPEFKTEYQQTNGKNPMPVTFTIGISMAF